MNIASLEPINLPEIILKHEVDIAKLKVRLISNWWDAELARELDVTVASLEKYQRLLDRMLGATNTGGRPRPNRVKKATKAAAGVDLYIRDLEDRLARAAWLQADLDDRKWGRHDLALASGVSWKSIQKVLDADPTVYPSTLKKLRRYLPKLP